MILSRFYPFLPLSLYLPSSFPQYLFSISIHIPNVPCKIAQSYYLIFDDRRIPFNAGIIFRFADRSGAFSWVNNKNNEQLPYILYDEERPNEVHILIILIPCRNRFRLSSVPPVINFGIKIFPCIDVRSCFWYQNKSILSPMLSCSLPFPVSFSNSMTLCFPLLYLHLPT